MVNYVVQNKARVLGVISDFEEARIFANSNRNSEFYMVKKETGDYIKTLMDLGISCRYTPKNK